MYYRATEAKNNDSIRNKKWIANSGEREVVKYGGTIGFETNQGENIFRSYKYRKKINKTI